VKLSKGVKEKKWSVRSQSSFQREAVLQDQLDNLQRGLRHDQALLAEMKADLDRQVKSMVSGNANVGGQIGQSISRVNEQQGRIEVLDACRAKIQSQFDAVAKVGPEEAKIRSEKQTELAQLSLHRLEADRALARVIETARGLLGRRSKTSEQMLRLCREIDLTLGFDGLDEDRFKALEASLPMDLEGKSQTWVDWFLGENRKTERYTVLDTTVVLTETLADAGVFRKGQQVDLTAEQVAEIQGTERTTVEYPSEPMTRGGYRAGSRVEVRNPRVEKCTEAST
jgi:hypothetical protein